MKPELSIRDIIDIRRKYQLNLPTSILASVYAVSPRTIQRIVKGDRWASVPQPASIKNFPNYEVTIDGRVWSKTKGEYLNGEIRSDGQLAVRLRKTLKNKRRVEKTMLVNELIKKHF